MQQHDLSTLHTQHDVHLSDARELVWDDVDYDLTDYHRLANTMQVERVIVRRDQQVAFPFSLDTAAQLILMIAQQLTYGQIRGQYQSCDMRHFRAGRTEAIRPVTLQAVNFMTSLEQRNATKAQFAAALEAHQE